jgi:type II secretory pathway pseudopilin PulG
MSNKRITTTSSGIALIELSIALVIIGLLTAGFFAFLNGQIEQKRLTETKEKMNLIRTTLAEYIKNDEDKDNTATENFDHTRWDIAEQFENDAIHYPCPAPLTAVIGDANFGIESRDNATNAIGQCDSTVAGVFEVAGTGGQLVYFGAIPTGTLNISSDNMQDPYGSKFLYAVSDRPSRNLALDVPIPPAGAITVNDRTGIIPPTSTADFTIVSHGENRSGSYPFNGSVRTPCIPGLEDTENCNFLADANFTVELHSEGNNADYFDDTVEFTFPKAELDFLPNCANGVSIMMNASGELVCGPPLICAGTVNTGGFLPLLANVQGCVANAPVGTTCRNSCSGGGNEILTCHVDGTWVFSSCPPEGASH